MRVVLIENFIFVIHFYDLVSKIVCVFKSLILIL